MRACAPRVAHALDRANGLDRGGLRSPDQLSRIHSVARLGEPDPRGSRDAPARRWQAGQGAGSRESGTGSSATTSGSSPGLSLVLARIEFAQAPVDEDAEGLIGRRAVARDHGGGSRIFHSGPAPAVSPQDWCSSPWRVDGQPPSHEAKRERAGIAEVEQQQRLVLGDISPCGRSALTIRASMSCWTRTIEAVVGESARRIG